MGSKTTVIIPAAGQGKRMNAAENKQFISLQGMPVIVHTLQAFEACETIDDIILVSAPGEEERFIPLINQYGITKVRYVVAGGRERQDSVFNGFLNVDKESEIVLIHDGARPFITKTIIEQAINVARIQGVALVAVPVKDTIKQVNNGLVQGTLERNVLWQAQTPQVFRYEIMQEALTKAREQGYLGTDDTSLAERLGFPVHIVEGSYENLKITTPEDLIIAEAILASRKEEGF